MSQPHHTPCTTAAIEAEYKTRSRPLEVSRVVLETQDAVSITFAPPEVGAGGFDYRPGQHLTVRIPVDGPTVARSYSLSSTPGDETGLTITIKRVTGGVGSNWLCDNAEVGLRLDVLPPAGRFVLADDDGDVVLVGAGSGITPLMSIARAVLSRPSGLVTLVYANRDTDSVIFANALRELQRMAPDRLRIVHWLESLQGFPSPTTLAGLLPGDSEARIFICGPGPFMEAAKDATRLLGIPRERVMSEVFVSLSGDVFAEISIIEPAAAEDPTAVNGVATLDGERIEFKWKRANTLVDTLIGLGVDVPCTCRLVRGDVDRGRTDILDPDDLADGYILGCQSRPTTDDVEVEF